MFGKSDYGLSRCGALLAVTTGVLFSLSKVSAESTASPPKIVLVSLANLGDPFFWFEGEQRIKQELRLSGYAVLSVNVGSDGLQVLSDQLKAELVAHDAEASILVTRRDREGARLLMVLSDGQGAVQDDSTYPIEATPTEDAAAVAALKASEAVRMDILQKRDVARLLAKRASRQKKYRDVSFIVAGASTMAVSGILAWKSARHGMDANDYSKRMEQYASERNLPAENSLRDDQSKEVRRYKMYLAGASVSCAVGVTMLIFGLRNRSLERGDSMKFSDEHPLSFDGTRLIWRF